ncbi:hypothetical protein ACFVWY_00460 [Streptomyces sp. NPDC058195]|uniref:hypothetical protein n=1 Tax=Streptomyces sp. NPDC058195 TaxID=3346375 RepID=UPI0036E6B783
MGVFHQPQLPPGPHKDLNEALHDLHLRAGCPSSRAIAQAISAGDFPLTASHERVRMAFSAPHLPAWPLVEALCGVLAPLAGSTPPREVNLVRGLWQDSRRPARSRPVPVIPASEPSAPWLTPAPRSTAETPSFGVDVVRAVREQLREALLLKDTSPLELAPEAEVPDSAGVYELFHHGRSVFVGRAERSVRSRIHQAHRKLSGRKGISVHDVAYRFVPMDASLADLSPERMIIHADDHPWNQNGFGSKDLGRQRDRTELTSRHFDLQYPIDLDWAIQYDIVEESLPQFLRAIRDALPYMFRYGKTSPNGTVENLRIASRTPAREIFSALAEGPLAGWQITAKPGYVIAYEERRAYPQTLAVFRQ